MFSTRKISMFFIGISAVSMSLFTVSFPTSVVAGDDNWPWGTPSQNSVAGGDDNWPWGTPSQNSAAAEDDNWPWGRSTGGGSGSATPTTEDDNWPWGKSAGGSTTLA